MTSDTSVTRYGKLSIALHWLMLSLFVGVYACVEIKGYGLAPPKPDTATPLS